MASNKLLVILAIVTVTLPTAAMASEFWVGDASGWTVGYDYQAWAKDKVFQVGDTLVFNYTEGHHNVIEANKTTFESCIIPPENVALLASGHDVITLTTQREKWYICGVANHCSELNQKLAITVEGGAPPPPPNTPGGLVYVVATVEGGALTPAPAPDNTSALIYVVAFVAGFFMFIVFPICVIRNMCKPRTLIPVRLWVEV